MFEPHDSRFKRRPDVVLRLRELRRILNLTQTDLARRSGVGAKTISSWETGDRADSVKIAQLERICSSVGLTIDQFFRGDLEAILEGRTSPVERLVDELQSLDPSVSTRITWSFLDQVQRTRDAAKRGTRLG